MSAARVTAAVIVVLTLGMNAGTVWTLFGTTFLARFADVGVTGGYEVFVYAAIAGFGAVSTSYVLVGLLLSGRQGTGRIAAGMLAGGALLASTPFGYAVGGQLAFEHPTSVVANALFLIGPVAFGPAFSLILPVLALIFPSGELPSRRWQMPVALILASLGLGTALALLRPGPITGTVGSLNPFGVEGLPAGLLATSNGLLSVGIVGFMVLGVAAVLIRYRRGDVTLRQQLRWFVAAALFTAGPLPLSVISNEWGPALGALACVGLLLVPVSVGIAVTRHRLYEIDRLLSRTIGWAVVTGLLVAVFGGMVLGLQALLADVTQGETLAVAASTLVAFALFQPVRRRVQSAVDRRFDRARYEGDRVVGAFNERLRGQIDLDSLQAEVRRVASETVRPASTALWVKKVPDRRPTAMS